jgi:hypothetical protein
LSIYLNSISYPVKNSTELRVFRFFVRNQDIAFVLEAGKWAGNFANDARHAFHKIEGTEPRDSILNKGLIFRKTIIQSRTD